MVDVGGAAAGDETPEAGPGNRRPARERFQYHSVWWALAFAAVTTVGLALVAWGLLILHAFVYGSAAVIQLEPIAPPDDARYLLAFTIAVTVNLATAAALAWIAWYTPVRTWPAALQGLAAAVLAAVAGVCALLLTLGINPVDFALAR